MKVVLTLDDIITIGLLIVFIIPIVLFLIMTKIQNKKTPKPKSKSVQIQRGNSKYNINIGTDDEEMYNKLMAIINGHDRKDSE